MSCALSIPPPIDWTTLSCVLRPLWRWLAPLGLRIDVEHGSDDIERELDTLYERMHTPGTPLHGMTFDDGTLPGFRLHTREADGEIYVYVEDVAARRFAGVTVFNRLIELDKRADRILRAPHSKYAAGYQRRGLASAVYRHALDGGMCLMSGARQSAGAHALWQSLAAQYASGYVEVCDKRLRYLGDAIDGDVRDALHTRRVLLGAGWTMAALAAATKMAT
ncbi:N-acetyltransferase [Ralstonia chuxiongensis]|uniref:N-acetyltransferase n=1 Tax=Ralstonia chuxiongensis TaxID=2957504 RepID=A0AA41WZV6_9RALS|nr:N-acetyltransferase [Ralstonia chuxiongensis]MCP1175444.1 N-acetyltransferase [Ralstonia chuxiongensis]